VTDGRRRVGPAAVVEARPRRASSVVTRQRALRLCGRSRRDEVKGRKNAVAFACATPGELRRRAADFEQWRRIGRGDW
jgi:hypothetical protein